jgi:hypothetical protein
VVVVVMVTQGVVMEKEKELILVLPMAMEGEVTEIFAGH